MTPVGRLLRLIEIALWVIAISLLGVASAATLDRWTYQTQQERALFERGPAVAEMVVVPPATPGPAPAPAEPAIAPTRRVETRHRAAAVDPTAVGRIEIPRLRLAAIVKEGVDEKTLARAVGLVPGSVRPGEPGNTVLSAHRDTFFRPLRKIRVNDRIRLIVPPHTYEYRVQSLRVVQPDETSVLESRGVEELTLVTCHPFYFVGPAPERFIVSALRVH